MPFGFTQHQIEKGKNPNTVRLQVVVIEQFFSYLRLNIKSEIDVKDIKQDHVKGFLDQQAQKQKMNTIYRKQSHIKVFFDYLYRSNQVDRDIMEKFDYFEITEVNRPYAASREPIEYTYLDLVKIKDHMLNLSKFPFLSKLLSVLYLKGIQLADMYDLKVDNFDLVSTKGNDKIILNYPAEQAGSEAIIEFDSPNDIEIIKQGIEIADSRGTPYLIHVLPKYGKSYVKSNTMLTRYYMHRIKTEGGIAFRSYDIRLVYVNYLYFEQHLSLNKIGKILGRSEDYISNLLNESIERIVKKEYNEEQMSLAL